MKTLIKILVWLACSAQVISGQDFQELAKFHASDLVPGVDARFGSAVDIYKSYAIVGASHEDKDADGLNSQLAAGAAYIYERDNMGNWQQTQKLVAQDREHSARFGTSVSISGDYAIVGAYSENKDADGLNYMGSAGAAYIFKRNSNGVWNEIQKIVHSDRTANDYFGMCVDISGNIAVIGASLESEDINGTNTIEYAGSAYIFERNTSGVWTQVAKIVPSDREERNNFGRYVSISEYTIVVGVPNHSLDVNGENAYTNAGASFIFERNVDGTWEETQKIVASDRSQGSRFGSSVSIDNIKILIGAEDVYGGGAAYIFSKDEDNWVQDQRIIASDRQRNDDFGKSVSLSGNTAVVGAYRKDTLIGGVERLNAGGAYIFTCNLDGHWSQAQEIAASDTDSNSYFGVAVSVCYQNMIIGGVYDSYLTDPKTGSTYIYSSCVPNASDNPYNILLNGKFSACEYDAVPWWLYANGATADSAMMSVRSGTCIVRIQSFSGNFGYIQLNQTFNNEQLGLIQMHGRYRLTFRAWANTAVRPIRVYLGEAEAPWNSYVSNEQINLSDESEQYTIEFTVTERFSTMALAFQLGDDDETVYFDEVRLERIGTDTDADGITDDIDNCPAMSNNSQTDTDGDAIGDACEADALSIAESITHPFRVYPNPAHSLLTIEARYGAVIRLYNVLGICVFNKTMDANKLRINISNYSSGFYLLTIHQEKRVLNYSLQIQ